MTKSPRITYKVFLFERVKKKLRLFNTETYPVQIRLTCGVRTLYIKSHFFSLLQLKKYQAESLLHNQPLSVDAIMLEEEKIIQYLINGLPADCSLEEIRKLYRSLSRDLLHELDELFKDFMVAFFQEAELPSYSLFIQQEGRNHSSEFLLNHLEKSLHFPVYDQLLQSASLHAPPYIPFVHFFRKEISSPLPLFPLYLWQEKHMPLKFSAFLKTAFPVVDADKASGFLSQLVESFNEPAV